MQKKVLKRQAKPQVVDEQTSTETETETEVKDPEIEEGADPFKALRAFR